MFGVHSRTLAVHNPCGHLIGACAGHRGQESSEAGHTPPCARSAADVTTLVDVASLEQSLDRLAVLLLVPTHTKACSKAKGVPLGHMAYRQLTVVGDESTTILVCRNHPRQTPAQNAKEMWFLLCPFRSQMSIITSSRNRQPRDFSNALGRNAHANQHETERSLFTVNSRRTPEKKPVMNSVMLSSGSHAMRGSRRSVAR